MNKKNILVALFASLSLFNACDGDSSSKPTSQQFPESGSIDWTEIPQSCDALVDGNVASISITFKNWSWTENNAFKENIIHTTQTFSGISQQEFNYFCNKEKNEGMNVVCDGLTISCDDYLQAGESAAFVGSMYTSACTQLLNGTVTLKEIFF